MAQKKDSKLFPREHFVRDQCCLFAQDCIVRLSHNVFTATRFREQIENLYYLQESLRDIDEFALKTLRNDLVSIIQICCVMTEIYEAFESLKPTRWYSVLELLKRENQLAEKTYYPRGKYNYFTIGNMLGVGGFGAVYKAWFGQITCCLKFVPHHIMPSAKHALADKQVASVINHPCLVKYYSTFMTSDAFVTCMEYLKGTDLSKLLKQTADGLPAEVVRLVIAQLGLALQHLHFKGFIHRDIKPDNIIIMSGCRIKLIDFDTCKVSMGKYSRKYMPTFNEKTYLEFSTNEVAGTLSYMPPEAFNETGLGRATDWWAVGVVAYEISTGILPFQGMTENQIHHAVVRGRYSWPQTKYWDSNLVQFVSACLATDTSERLCSARYSEFQSHSYFAGIDFRWIETAPVLCNYALIDEVIARIPAHAAECYTYNSPESEFRRARLFPHMNFRDVDTQESIYSFSSPGFIRCIEALRKGRVPTVNDIYEESEFLDVEDDYTVPYVFTNFLKELAAEPATASPKEATKDPGQSNNNYTGKFRKSHSSPINTKMYMSFKPHELKQEPCPAATEAPPSTNSGNVRGDDNALRPSTKPLTGSKQARISSSESDFRVKTLPLRSIDADQQKTTTKQTNETPAAADDTDRRQTVIRKAKSKHKLSSKNACQTTELKDANGTSVKSSRKNSTLKTKSRT